MYSTFISEVWYFKKSSSSYLSLIFPIETSGIVEQNSEEVDCVTVPFFNSDNGGDIYVIEFDDFQGLIRRTGYGDIYWECCGYSDNHANVTVSILDKELMKEFESCGKLG